MGATGGGAHTYAQDWERIVGIQMNKHEEMECMVVGMQFILSYVVGECYTFKPNVDQNGANFISKHLSFAYSNIYCNYKNRRSFHRQNIILNFIISSQDGYNKPTKVELRHKQSKHHA